MAYAFFNAVNIFGAELQMQTVDNPRAQQINAFPGLSGLESLDQGLRGRYTNCTGRLVAASVAGLAYLEEFFRSYNDGVAYVLVDTRGVTWLNVKLESFEPQGKIRIHGGTGYVSRPYAARFMHL